jgi:hypothetical protein
MCDSDCILDAFKFTSNFGYNRDQSLKVFTNLQKLNLHGNNIITDASLKDLTNLKELNLCGNNSITDASVKHLTNLKKLNLQENKSISGKSLIYLTNLTSLTLSIPKDANPTVFGPVLEHLPKLNDLTLAVERPFNHANLLSLTNLTRLRIDWHIKQPYPLYGYNVSSELWKGLPKLESYHSTPFDFRNFNFNLEGWQTRNHFSHEQ